MTEEILELGEISKQMFLAGIPPDMKPEAEQFIRDELAAGRMVWDATEAGPCKA